MLSQTASALNTSPVDSIVHVIQVSLAPAFLLSALATLLNVFSTRLGRVSDKVDAIRSSLTTAGPEQADTLRRRLARLRRRSFVLDTAVILASFGGVMTGVAVLTLFVGALRDASTESVLFACFGAALLCTIGALAAFMIEILLAGQHIRSTAANSSRKASDPG